MCANRRRNVRTGTVINLCEYNESGYLALTAFIPASASTLFGGFQ